MRVYEPDAWVIVRIDHGGEVIHKVMGGWYGGFAGADSWRLNSGIVLTEKDGDHYRFYGHSGSIYYVHKDNQRATMLMSGVIAQLNERADGGAHVVDVSELNVLDAAEAR